MRPMLAGPIVEWVSDAQQQTCLGSILIDEGGMILVVNGEIRPKVSCQWYLKFSQLVLGGGIQALTGRRKSRNHQIA